MPDGFQKDIQENDPIAVLLEQLNDLLHEVSVPENSLICQSIWKKMQS